MPSTPTNKITHWVHGEDCCNSAWEAAYNRFETRKQEREKFLKRLRAMGVTTLPRETRIADLFCGRGSNLDVLEELGFSDLIGVDLSPSLLEQYHGKARLFVGDCRDLHLPDESLDLVIVQGGLHHLPQLPEDLEAVFVQIQRVLAPNGAAVFIEPAWTPFLRFVHLCCEQSLFRRLYPRLDALAVMTEHEEKTYFNWLSRMKEISALAERCFEPTLNRQSFGKWYFLGHKKLPQG